MSDGNDKHEALMLCLACQRQFYAARGPTVCLLCGEAYVKWLNVGAIRPDLANLYNI